MIDGKLYIFGGQASKDGFEIDEKKNLALAEAYWNDEVAGNNSFVQRWKRLIFRVPHYQSGEALAKAVAEARAKAAPPSEIAAPDPDRPRGPASDPRRTARRPDRRRQRRSRPSTSTTRSARGSLPRSPSCPSTTRRAPKARSSPTWTAWRGTRPGADTGRPRRRQLRESRPPVCGAAGATLRRGRHLGGLPARVAAAPAAAASGDRDAGHRSRFLGVAAPAGRSRCRAATLFYPGSSIGNFTPQRRWPSCARRTPSVTAGRC
jgi:hypothetical protein